MATRIPKKQKKRADSDGHEEKRSVGPARPLYSSKIVQRDIGPEQSFDANLVVIQSIDGMPVIALGELRADPGKPLKFGTPIHHLILQLPSAEVEDEDVSIEFNGQGNMRFSRDLERLELSTSSLCVVYRSGAGPFSGRVSLSREIEIFDDGSDAKSIALRSVRVGLTGVKAQFEPLLKALKKHPTTAAKLVRTRKDSRESA